MKSSFKLFAAAAFGLSTLTFAADLTGPASDAVHKMYPSDTVTVKSTKSVNGVNVHDLEIKTSDNHHTWATVTDNGEFIVAGLHRKDKPAPKAVDDVVAGLFKANASDSMPFEMVTYTVQLVDNGKTYLATLDPVGRIVDLASSAELASEQSAKTKEDLAFSKVIAESELPAPAKHTVDELFHGAKIGQARRYTQVYWRFDHHLGDEILNLKVREDGDIISVSSREAPAGSSAAPSLHPTPSAKEEPKKK